MTSVVGSPDEEPFDDESLNAQFPGLQEILAEHVHDTWAARRRAEGWRYGERRDDIAKEHPGLVPYADLSESEKAYDRSTAFETLRVVLQNGYKITAPSAEELEHRDGDRDRSAHPATASLIASHSALSASDLVAAFHALPIEEKWRNEIFACWAIRRLLELSEPILAFDLVSEALEAIPDHVQLKQLKGLALARAGATQKANQIFRELFDTGHRDEETLGNLARTYKSLWETAATSEQQKTHLREALQAYQRSYEATNGYWSGINVAFLALMQGDDERAASVSDEVQSICKQELSNATDNSSRYWLLATLAEAALISNRVNEAVSYYKQAADLDGSRLGSIASTSKQALRIAKHLGIEWSTFESCFTRPEVLVYQSTSASESEAQLRAPESLADLGELVDFSQPVIAFSSLVHEDEVTFLEAVLRLGGDIAVLLSSDDDTNASPSDVAASNMQERIASLLESSREVHSLTTRTVESGSTEDAYRERILIGLANMHARQFGLKPRILSVNSSGTFDRQGKTILPGRLCDLSVSNRDTQHHSGDHSHSASTKADSREPGQIVDFEPRMMSLLFADVKGFSSLAESQLLRFANEFLGQVSRYMHSSVETMPVTRHTWGDGLFLTFETVRGAGQFALHLASLVEQVDWASHGLPEDLSIRIGLHAGPVYECFDPISDKTTFLGIHVNHAARIEPITPPGNVYASEAFAALASEQRIPDFRCEYVGRTPLAKGFGMFATYHVRQASFQ